MKEIIKTYVYGNKNKYPDYILKLNTKCQLQDLRQISEDLKKLDKHNHYKLEDIIEDLEETYQELGWL